MSSPNRRLDSWKEIAGYLGRGPSTVRRWEEEKGLPVHRVPGGARQAVFAFTGEIDRWLLEAGDETARADLSDPSSKVLQMAAGCVVAVPQSDNEPLRPVPVTAGASVRSGRTRTTLAWAALLAVVTCAALYAWLLDRPLAAPRVRRYTQLTNDGARKLAPVVTDGIRLFFSEPTETGPVVCQIPVSGGQPVRLPGTAGLLIDDISPTGAELAARKPGPTGTDSWLCTVPLAGGAPRGLGVSATAAAFSPDGRRLAYASGSALCLANADGGNPRRIAQIAGVYGIRWSPDGKYLRLNIDEPARSMPWQISTDGTGLEPVLAEWPAPRLSMQSWTPDGRYALLHSRASGSGDLWAIRERAGTPNRRRIFQLTNGPIDLAGAVISRDGKKLFAVGTMPRGEILRWNPKSRQFAPWLFGVSADGVTFSPDGQSVAYSLWPERTLWRSRIDGTDRRQLTSSVLEALVPRWSPDGRTLAFMARGIGGKAAWNVSLIQAAGGSPEALLPSDSEGASPSWSPDGRSLAFARAPWLHGFARESTAVSILDVRTRQVSKLEGSDGLWSPKWSPDGRYIAAETVDSLEIRLFDTNTRRWSSLARFDGPGSIGYMCWPRASDSVYFNTAYRIYRVSLRDHKIAAVSSLSHIPLAATLGEWFGLAPDDSPMLLHDTSIQEIYALDVDLP